MPQHGRKSSLTVEQEKEVYMGRRGSLNSLSPPKVDGDRRRGSLLARYLFHLFYFKLNTTFLLSVKILKLKISAVYQKSFYFFNYSLSV